VNSKLQLTFNNKEVVMADKKENPKKAVVEDTVQEDVQPREMVRAEAGKRIAAAMMDGIPAYVISFIPYIGGLISAAYLALRDGLPLSPEGGQSLGKRLFQLRAVRLPDNAPCDYGASLLRNLPFLVPALLMVRPGIGWFFGSVLWVAVLVVEILLVIADENGQRIGDRLAKTQVIQTKT
jgi:uncharacterized RDD family membrane protein YckC